MPFPEINSAVKNSEKPAPLGCGQLILFIALWMWVALVTLGRLSSQMLSSAALNQIPQAAWAIFPLVQGFLLVVPLGVAVLAWRSKPWNGILKVWLAASAAVLLLAPISLLPSSSSQAHAILSILLLLVFLFILYSLTRPKDDAQAAGAANRQTQSELAGSPDERAGSAAAVPLALLAVALTVWPWMLWGALGSLLDTVLQVAVGLAFGWAAAASLERLLFPALRQSGMSYKAAYLIGGFAAGTAVMVFASSLGFAFGGLQALLALSLPSLGWMAVGLVWYRREALPAADSPPSNRSQLAVFLLFGLGAAVPLAFIDPDELAVLISGTAGEILGWGLEAAALAGMIGLLLSAAFYIWRPFRREQAGATPGITRQVTWAAAGFVWLIVLGVYLLAGQPGFYGEQIFVVLEEQADLSGVSSIPDPLQRRAAVYQMLVETAQSSQAQLRSSLDRFSLDYTPYYLVNGLRVNGGPLVAAWLSRQPGVASVLDAPYMRPLPEPPPTASGDAPAPSGPPWNLELIGADRVHQELGVTGEGILIGQSDSGVQGDHPDLLDSYRGMNPDGSLNHAYNWYDPWNGSPSPVDIGGHGTHTLGTILGNSTGVAPDALWIGCTNLARNLGNLPYYLDCLQFMLAPFPPGSDPLTAGDPARGAHILNNSWGCPENEGCSPDSLAPATQALSAAGVFVVASAGNDGPFCSSVTDPLAIYDSVFSVGASNQWGDWVSFSSIGPVTVDGSGRIKPDLIAPGESVLSTMPGETYGLISGTSMAGPHVAGTVALMWSANPALIGDIGATRQILQQTARPYDGPLPECSGAQRIPSTAVGYGLLDAYAAVQASLQR